MTQFNDDYFLQVSYAKILGSRLERFHVKKESPFLASARCPVCGDSSKSKTKTRFSLYEKHHSINAACFNCGLSTTLVKFLKLYQPALFNEFKFDRFRTLQTEEPVIQKKKEDFTLPKIVVKSILDLPLITDLPDDHAASVYVKSRELPDYPFYFCDKFFKFSSQYNDEFKSFKKDEPRIIIPFFDKRGKIFAYQGRDFVGHSKQKYITVKIEPKAPLLFGLEKLDTSKQILLVEGPLDSLFLKNSIASVNASLSATAKWLLSGINKSPDSLTIILDNEQRNPTIVKEYEKAIESGYKTVIWPRSVSSYKDINEMVINGINPVEIIKKNTFSGLEARINFNNWKKVK